MLLDTMKTESPWRESLVSLEEDLLNFSKDLSNLTDVTISCFQRIPCDENLLNRLRQCRGNFLANRNEREDEQKQNESAEECKFSERKRSLRSFVKKSVAVGSKTSLGRLKTCKICGVRVKHLRPHVKYSHGVRVACKLCGKPVPKIHYRNHLFEGHGIKEGFTTHTTDREVFQCLYCGKKRLHMDAHVKYAHGPQVKCYMCDTYVPELYLTGHVKYYHHSE